MNEDEACARCGDGPHDLRTLWMACLYDMGELPLPFKQVELQGARYAEQNGTKRLEFWDLTAPVFNESTSDPHGYRFYTLRVCKDCRADWMQAIQGWFQATPTDPDACNSGFYTRVMGANRQVPPDDLL